jgi:hypothetical protein
MRVAQRNVKAFTLVEVIAGMTIFSLISVGIFGIIFQTGVEAGAIRDAETRDQQINRFVTLLRESLEALPQDSTVSLANPEDTESGWPELTFSGTSTAFVFGINPGAESDSVIGLRPVTSPPPGLEEYSEPLFNISLSREEFANEGNESDMQVRAGADDIFVDEDEEGRRWLPLVENVTALGWRYWDTDELMWVELDDWNEGDSMPALLEMTLADPWRPSLRVVFRIPLHARNAADNANGGNQSTTSTSGSSATQNQTTVQPQRPAPGGGRGGGGGDFRGGGGGRDGGGRPGGGRPGGGGGGDRPGGGGGPPAGGGGGRPSGGGGGAAAGGGGGGGR